MRAAAGMAARSVFAQAYQEALQDLTTPDMAKIKLLRDLAKENKAEAPGVVQVLAQHIQKCKESMRLPAVYLMDCMLKTVDAPYPELLAATLPQVFSFVWDRSGPEVRHKLVRTAGTWKDFLPANTLAIITQKCQPVPHQQSLLQQAPMQPAVLPQPVVVVQPQQPMLAYSAAGQPIVIGAAPGVLQQAAVPWPSAMATLLPTAIRPVAAATLAPTAPDMAALLSHLKQQVDATQQQKQALVNTASAGGSKPQDATQAMVDALFSASDKTRPKFLDLQFLRNRRLQNSTHLVRPWYVKVDQWLVGTRATEQAPVVFFDEEQGAQGASAGSKAHEPMLVEEDLSQPSCAISGETFERTYDPDTDKWYYEDAVVLTGPQAAAFGVMEGSIVKASCLAGAPPPVAAAVVRGPGVAPAATTKSAGGGGAPLAVAAAEQGTHTAGVEVGVVAMRGGPDGTLTVSPQQQVQQQPVPQKRVHLQEHDATGVALGQHAGHAAGAPPDLKRARVEGVAS